MSCSRCSDADAFHYRTQYNDQQPLGNLVLSGTLFYTVLLSSGLKRKIPSLRYIADPDLIRQLRIKLTLHMVFESALLFFVFALGALPDTGQSHVLHQLSDKSDRGRMPLILQDSAYLFGLQDLIALIINLPDTFPEFFSPDFVPFAGRFAAKYVVVKGAARNT